jgi:hypothetical protein
MNAGEPTAEVHRIAYTRFPAFNQLSRGPGSLILALGH